MRAVRYHRYGDPTVLTVEEAPDPTPGPGEIRIRVAAASVNPVDWKVRSGAVRDFLPVDLPAIPGRDAVGLVDRIGEGVQGVGIGDRVFGLGGVTGATAELAVLSAWAPAPAAWSDAEAAGAALAAVTALSGLKALGPLSGRTLLVEGAAGGVGGAAVELAVAAGASEQRVVVRARRPDHRRWARCPRRTGRAWRSVWRTWRRRGSTWCSTPPRRVRSGNWWRSPATPPAW